MLPGGKIFFRLWQKKNGQSGRALYLVHGQGEQSDRYTHFPFYLSNTVDAIACVDLPGHGQSNGIRGHINNFDQYSDAVVTGFQHFRAKIGSEKETHWLGHSLGGLITLRTLLAKQNLNLASVTASAPLLGLALKAPKIKSMAARLIEPVLGQLPLDNELDAQTISRDASVVAEYSNNKLNHGKVTPRFFVRLMREMELMKAPQNEFAYNLMMLSPLSDKIVSWQSGLSFYERLKMKSGSKKEYQSFPDFYHESFNETGKDRAFACLESWILKNSRRPS